MNERQPYEQLMADKLQRLPSPDADTSWQQMKRLLDDEDNKTGGGKKRPGGWWKTGLMAIALIAGLWFYSESRKTSQKDLSSVDAASKKETANNNSKTETNKNDNNKSTITDNNATLNPSNASKQNTADKNNVSAKDDATISIPAKNNVADKKAGTGATDINAGTAIVSGNSDKNATKKINTKNKPVSNAGTDNSNVLLAEKAKADANASLRENTGATNESVFNKTNKGKNNKGNLNADDRDINTANNEIASSAGKANKLKKNKIGITTVLEEPAESETNEPTSLNKNNKPKTKTGKNFRFQPTQTVTGSDLSYIDDKLKGSLIDLSSPFRGTGGLVSSPSVDSIASLPETSKLLTRETKALATRAKNENEAAIMAKKEKKSLKLNFSGFFKPFSLRVDAEPWWAAGLAINHAVGVNNQNRYSYNVNAKSGLIGDYIPSPFVQFHLNDYVYMQTELNLSMPQLTPQLLVYQRSADIAGASGMRQEKSIYVQKLYYFNWPVSLHYSPVNNLYLSAGIQFSSFQSGLALIQTKTFDTQVNPAYPISTNNSIEKFKDDSIAAKLSPTEWRWQAGADYYWNRFSIGIRYNKSFKDLLNVTVDHNLTTNRNAAFLLFVRYNLFEGRKKDNSEPKQNLARY